MAYPVSVSVVPQLANRNRLTTAFRLILAIPHFFLVGGAVMWSVGSGDWAPGGSREALSLSNTGVLGFIAWCLAIVSWLTIVLSGRHVEGIRELTRFILRWRTRAIAYSMLLVDDYPPFGDGPYPVAVEVVDPVAARNRLTVGLRLLLVIPHLIVLFFVVSGWWITSTIAWVAILLTTRYPEGLYGFGVGVLRWVIRVEAYLLLLVDEYPPFSLE